MGELSKETKAYRNKLKYIKKFNGKYYRLYILFNPQTEADLIDWVQGKKKATYVKNLIRKDMSEHGI